MCCMTAWYSSCSAADQKALQCITMTAETITGLQLLDTEASTMIAVSGGPLRSPLTQLTLEMIYAVFCPHVKDTGPYIPAQPDSGTASIPELLPC